MRQNRGEGSLLPESYSGEEPGREQISYSVECKRWLMLQRPLDRIAETVRAGFSALRSQYSRTLFRAAISADVVLMYWP